MFVRFTHLILLNGVRTAALVGQEIGNGFENAGCILNALIGYWLENRYCKMWLFVANLQAYTSCPTSNRAYLSQVISIKNQNGPPLRNY